MSRVVVVKYIGNQTGQGLSQAQYESLLSAGLKALSGEPTPEAALSVFLPKGVIGMKANCLTHKANSTSLSLADALTALLVRSGKEEKNVVIWERSGRELAATGYKLNAASSQRKCLGTDSAIAGYSDDFYSFGEVNSRVSRILTEIVDANINLPVLKDHSVAGMSGCMKNMYGAIHNPNKYHGNNCDPFCAHISNLEPLRQMNRLVVMDAVRVQYNGGPGYVGDYIANYGGIILSVDPVASDRVGLEIIEKLRSHNGLASLREAGRPVRYLDTAQKLGMGVAELARIDLVVHNVAENGQAVKGELF